MYLHPAMIWLIIHRCQLHSRCSLLRVTALGQLLPFARQNSLPTNIFSCGNHIIIDIYELYQWQILQTKPTIHVPIRKYVPTTVKCGGQTFWWAGGAKLDKSSPTCWSTLVARLLKASICLFLSCGGLLLPVLWQERSNKLESPYPTLLHQSIKKFAHHTLQWWTHIF